MKRVQNVFSKAIVIAVVGIGLSACASGPVPASYPTNAAYAYPDYRWEDPEWGWDPDAHLHFSFDDRRRHEDPDHHFDHAADHDSDHDDAHDSGGASQGAAHGDGGHDGGGDDGGHDGGGHDGGGHDGGHR